jgi:hypothetical protein
MHWPEAHQFQPKDVTCLYLMMNNIIGTPLHYGGFFMVQAKMHACRCWHDICEKVMQVIFVSAHSENFCRKGKVSA